MENASKAIVIAGGVLISICVISVFYFMFRQIGGTVEITQPKTAQKELNDFNKGFEAYNKKLMYGADIISVLNKAIDNNRKYKIEYGKAEDLMDLDYYVNIIFTYEDRTYSLKQDFTKQKNIIQENFLDKAGLKSTEGTEGEDIFQFKVSGFKCTRYNIQ